ncbi:hypothetical protein UY3_10779 [Chelonia mydas]|uniref:Myb/SANT-like DNA-binding domain-containing protein n=1 Tax=Chelonia mydas TaxID=8469 RepID=M7B4Q8_CHEMY|nr:hypothetical protein UY3_10779 [Chelonia mydas]
MQSSSAEVTMMESQNRKRAPAWTEREVRDLITVWGEESVQSELRSSFRNAKTFVKISQGMKDRGHNRDPKQCRVKLKELRQAYQKTREANGRSGLPRWPELIGRGDHAELISRGDRDGVPESQKSSSMDRTGEPAPPAGALIPSLTQPPISVCQRPWYNVFLIRAPVCYHNIIIIIMDGSCYPLPMLQGEQSRTEVILPTLGPYMPTADAARSGLTSSCKTVQKCELKVLQLSSFSVTYTLHQHLDSHHAPEQMKSGQTDGTEKNQTSLGNLKCEAMIQRCSTMAVAIDLDDVSASSIPD